MYLNKRLFITVPYVLVLLGYSKQDSNCPDNTTNNVFTSTGGSATIQYNANSLPVSDTPLIYSMKDPGGTTRAQFATQSGNITSSEVQVLNLTSTGDDFTGNLSFRIDNIQTGDTGVYMIVKNTEPHTALLCNIIYITGNLSVPSLNYPLKTPSVGERVVLTCSSSSSTIPASLPLIYIWLVNGEINPTDSRYTYSSTRDTLTISRVHESDTDTVFNCKAQEQGSQISSNNSSQFRMDVFYSPMIVDTSVTPQDVTECTDRLTLTCKVDSKPASTITWYKGQDALSRTGLTNSGLYIINDVQRTVAGQYRCKASNGIGEDANESVNVTVQYNPDVSVTTTNVTTNYQHVDIACDPFGIPEQYSFSPWIHQWTVNGPLIEHPGLGNNHVLRLTNLTYEYTGFYTCRATNGINCSSNPNAGSGYVYLETKAPPFILYPNQNTHEKRITLITKLHRRVTFNITFWSNGGNTTVMCYRRNDCVRGATLVGVVTMSSTTVALPVFSTFVTSTGTLAKWEMDVKDHHDFGSYEIIISNEVGESNPMFLRILLQGFPDIPVLYSVKALGHLMIVIAWSPGFHGGLNQTVVIQTSVDMIHWDNKTYVPIGMEEDAGIQLSDIARLTPSTIYYVRLFAYNDEGRLDSYTRTMNCTTGAGFPDIPVLYSVKALGHLMIVIAWSPGFHGGLNQTVVIQTSVDMIHWDNKTYVPIGMEEDAGIQLSDIARLTPSTIYYVRLFAYNDEGRLDSYTRTMNCTTGAASTDISSLNVGLLVGLPSGIIAFAVIVGLGYLFIRTERCKNQRANDLLELTESKMANSESDIQGETEEDNLGIEDSDIGENRTESQHFYEGITDITQPEHVYMEVEEKDRSKNSASKS